MKRFKHIVLLLTLAIGWCSALLAQQTKQLPDVTSTEGREFFVAWMPNGGSDLQSQDLKLQLMVSTRKPNTVVVEYANGMTRSYPIAGGYTRLIDDIDPQLVYWDPSAGEEEMILQKGIRVYSQNDEKFTLYSTNQMGTLGSFSYDGAHIIPVEALGTEYMVQSADGDAIATEFVIVSTKPGETNVTMDLKVNSRKSGTQHLEVTLTGPKQIYIVRSKAPDPENINDFIDLSGSTICADQPIAVWSGNQYAIVPNQQGLSNDHAYDQLLPLNKWGKTFMVPMTAANTQLNIMRIVAQQDGTEVSLKRGTAAATTQTLNSGDTYTQRMVQSINNTNPQNFTYYVTATKPIQVYLYSTSAGVNNWYDDDGNNHLPSNPSMTLIPPLEFMTDTTIFSTFNGGEGSLVHMLNLIAYSSQISRVRLDGATVTGWKTIPSNNAYSQLTCEITDGVHTITAPDKCFTGYAFGITEGEAYLYPVGYDFTPKEDSLFLKGEAAQYPVHESVWKANAISPTEGGWHLDKILLDNGKYLLDSIIVCDSTILDFPIKTYTAWEKVRWEIQGSIQGMGYFTPEEQLSASTARPELEHQFHLLPIEENNEPFEDFEVRGIIFHKPIICDIPEDKWEKDTLNTIVRVLRQYNDTTWKAICDGETFEFFKDTVWTSSTTYTLEPTIFNNESGTPSGIGRYKYQLGANTITRSYISSGGCDSLSTLKLFVCSPDSVHKDTVICEDEMLGLDFGEFFKQYKGTINWPKGENTLRDVLRATECMSDPDWAEFAPHCKDFDGCDSILELHLTVKEVVRNTKRQNQCLSLGTTYDWYEEESGRLIRSFSVDTMVVGKQYLYRDTVKYVNCVDCPDGGCDSVRNTLYLTFVSDEGQKHTIHVCQGKDTTYANMSDSYRFDSRGKVCNTPYKHNLTVHVYGIVDGVRTVLCQFTDELTFYVDTVYDNQMDYDTICWDPLATDQTYPWANHPKVHIPVTGPGLFTYRDTLKTWKCGDAGGCDSICILKLRVGQPYETPTLAEICDNESFKWQDTLFYGINYKGAKPLKSKQVTGDLYTSQRDTLSQYGCDSILTLHLTIWRTYVAARKDTDICANQEYDFFGTIYNTATNPWTPGQTYELKKNVPSVHGCDSAVLHYVTVYPIYLNEREENDTVCQVLEGDAYYEWPGEAHEAWNSKQLQSLRTAGTYELVDPLHTIHGCDSIIHRTLVIMPSYNLSSFSHTMSSESWYEWEHRIYAGENAVVENPLGLPVIRCSGVTIITDSLHTDPIGTHSCDSVRTLTLKIGQVFRDTTYDAACINCGTYNWVLTSPITGEDTTIYITDLPLPHDTLTYYDSLITTMGFDSIYVLRLTGYQNYNYSEPGEVCQGQPYTWAGHTSVSIPTDQYGTFDIVDHLHTTEIYTNPKTGQTKEMKCDSIWTLHLTIHPTYNDRYEELTDYRSMSSNSMIVHFTQPQTLFVGYDFDYAAAGTSKAELEEQYDRVVYIRQTGDEKWRDSVVNTSIYGCDSVHYVQIAICEIKFTQFADSIADNDTIWSFGGETAFGEHTLPLVTGERFHYYDDGTPVDYEQAEGRQEREYFFIDTLRTANGCDSIVHQTLHVFPSYRFEFDTAICSNKQYNWRDYTYLNRERTGYFYDSVNYRVGKHVFDSVFVLYLDVIPSGYWSFDTTVCMNDTINWYYQKVYYQNNGLKYVEATYKDEGSMCGDIYHLDLHFAPFYGKDLVEYDTICQMEDFHWYSPNETNEHKMALRDEAGHPLAKIPTDVAGTFVFYDSLHTVGCGCDSTYTLNLVIKPSYHFYDTLFTLCSSDTLEWHGTKYYYQGKADVADTIFDQSTVHACDSNYYLKVHFDLSYDTTDSVSLCSDDGHFSWEDLVFDEVLEESHTWDAPRDFYYTREYKTKISGCDSIRHLKLHIGPSYDSIWTDTLCQGETYHLFNQHLTKPGDYTDVQTNRFGCNTYYYLHLVEMPLPTFELDIEPICVDEDGMANNYLLHYTYEGNYPPISYSIRYGETAKAAGFEDEDHVPIAPGQTTLFLPVPPFAKRDQYPRPGTYDATIAFQNGVCLSDSLMTYPFVMNMLYPAWITSQHWNDAIFIMDSTLNGGYSFASYQWYRNDSILYGETKPYLYAPQHLIDGARYSVELTRSDDSITVRTCPIIPDLSRMYQKSPEQTYISIVPTVVAKENPTVYILSPTPGTYKLLNPQGQLVKQGAYSPDATNTYPVTLPQTTGIYVFHLIESTTAGGGNDLSRTVKVIVQ